MKRIVSLIMLAVLAIAGFGFVPMLAGADEMEVQHTWVQVSGHIERFGPTAAFGWLGAHAKMQTVNSTTGEWAEAHACWVNSTVGMIPGGNFSMANFTYSFYAARLVNASLIALNYSGYDFYISGLWDAINVTFVYYPNGEGVFDGENFNCTMEPVASNATGELRVFEGWTKFELDITGVELVSGVVYHRFVGTVDIEIGDVTGEGKVDINDLVHVAHAYGCRPGIGKYSFEMDFNDDFQIDVGDLATVAANIKA